jgi:glycosyltransferase involved in cell wall biosynthesis
MNPIRILVDSFADADLINAQMANAREIMSRLDERFHVSTFVVGNPDPRLVRRPGTRLIQLPRARQTSRILSEFLWGKHEIVFYLKASPAARIYLAVRSKWMDKRAVVGLMESQSDFQNEPTIKPEAIRLWEKTVLRSDFLFSNSQAVKENLEKVYGRSSEVLSTGVDVLFFTPDWDRTPNSRVQVLFVGSLRPFKGPQLLLRAASTFPEADFVVVGDGIMAAELHARVRDQRLTNVTLTGSLSPVDLRDRYRRADIFLFPSRWEGSPKVLMEASACGLPVIARREYRPETVIHGNTGFLGESDAELLESLGKLIQDPQLCRTMGQAARAHIGQFDWECITRMWEQVFLRLVLERRKANG